MAQKGKISKQDLDTSSISLRILKTVIKTNLPSTTKIMKPLTFSNKGEIEDEYILDESHLWKTSIGSTSEAESVH